MTQTIERVMTRDPVTVEHKATVREAAKKMAKADIGDVIVMRDGKAYGIVTDRDVVIRCIAKGGEPSEMRVDEICSTNLVTVRPTDTIADAATLMRNRALKRLVVEQDGNPLGVVTVGDVERLQRPDSIEAHIAEAPPNR